MITTVHGLGVVVLHVTMLGVRHLLVTMHIAGHGLHRLRREQYKNGQKDVFHADIITFGGTHRMAGPGLKSSRCPSCPSRFGHDRFVPVMVADQSCFRCVPLPAPLRRPRKNSTRPETARNPRTNAKRS